METNEKVELLIKLLSDEKFFASMNDTENDVSKMKALFASKGLELSDDKINVIIEALDEAKKSMYNGEGLSEEELNDISGGGFEISEKSQRIAEKAMKAIMITGGVIVTTVGLAEATYAAKEAIKGIDNEANKSNLWGCREKDYVGAAWKGAKGGHKALMKDLSVMGKSLKSGINNAIGNFLGK